MTHPLHDHECTECGNTTVYHVHEHEGEGDRATAFCLGCDDDTEHEIGEFAGFLA